MPPSCLPLSPHDDSPPPGIITKPHRIILVRHGESTGNVDEKVYVRTPDWKVSLPRPAFGLALPSNQPWSLVDANPPNPPL